MAHLVLFSIFGAVLAAADPTLRPSTPPTQRPTTSSTPQPTDLIRVLEQDVQSAPFDLPSNTCAAFQEPEFDTPATGQLDQPVSAGYGHGGNWATATPASAPPVEQSSGWTPAQQANVYK